MSNFFFRFFAYLNQTRKWMFVFLWMASVCTANATSYTLPSGFGIAPFNSCTLSSGTTYNCGTLNTGNNNAINVTSSITINASGFTLGTGTTWTVSNGATVTISVTSGGSINIGNNSTVTANLVSNEDMTIGSNVTLTGNVSDSGKTVKVGSGTAIYGNVSTGTIDFNGGNGVIYGNCTPPSSHCTSSSSLNHVEIVHNGSALTCTPKAVTVLACTAAASCNGVTANQSSAAFPFTPVPATGGQWCSDALCNTPVTGSISVTNGQTLYVRNPNARTDTLSATVSSAASTAVQCTNTATGATNASSACNLTYQSAGFLVSVANHVACTSQSITLQAVQSSATSNTCIPAFQNVTRNVQLSTTYVNPVSGSRSANLSYLTSSGGGSSSLASLSPQASSPSTLSNLYFDNTGRATLTNFQYPDVGQVALNPVYSGSAATGDSGLALTAISGNTFIAVPAGFAFSAITSPQVAGNPVAVTVTAQNACATPGTAPNFGQEMTTQTVNLSSTNPQPALGNATAISQSLTAFTNGSAAANIIWMEVGTIDLVAAVTNYLGSGLNATSTKLAVGRFIPSYFDTQVTAACSSFSYSGQPFSSQVTAHATGTATAAGAVTANYGGATWAKAVALSDANGVTGTLTPSTVAATSFNGGTATTSTAFTFTSAQTVPSLIALKATDTDSVSSNTANQATTTIRSGRLRALNSYGSDLLPLPVPVTAQYWNGLGWVTNTADNCTKLPVPTSGNGLVYNGGISATKITPSMNGVTSGNTTLLAGDAGFKFSAPGKGNYGYVDITIASPAWLMYPWSGSGNVKPNAKAVFGIYKSPLIYMRENY